MKNLSEVYPGEPKLGTVSRGLTKCRVATPADFSEQLRPADVLKHATDMGVIADIYACHASQSCSLERRLHHED